MNPTEPVWSWVAAVLGAAVLGLVAAFYYVGRRRDEQRDDSIQQTNDNLADHITKDIECHASHGERIARLEEAKERHEVELTRIRDGYHNILREVHEILLRWQSEFVTKVFDKLVEIINKLGRRDQ